MTNKSTLDVLIEARALIAKPENWTTGYYARNAAGAHVWEPSTGFSFCAVGAVIRASGLKVRGWPVDDTNLFLARAAITTLDQYTGLKALSGGAVLFNDTHTHAEVLALFDRAIAALRVPDQRDAQVQSIINQALDAAQATRVPVAAE